MNHEARDSHHPQPDSDHATTGLKSVESADSEVKHNGRDNPHISADSLRPISVEDNWDAKMAQIEEATNKLIKENRRRGIEDEEKMMSDFEARQSKFTASLPLGEAGKPTGVLGTPKSFEGFGQRMDKLGVENEIMDDLNMGKSGEDAVAKVTTKPAKSQREKKRRSRSRRCMNRTISWHRLCDRCPRFIAAYPSYFRKIFSHLPQEQQSVEDAY